MAIYEAFYGLQKGGRYMTDWITVAAASRKANVSDGTIRNWIDKGRIVAKKEKGRWLVDESSLTEIGNDSRTSGALRWLDD